MFSSTQQLKANKIRDSISVGGRITSAPIVTSTENVTEMNDNDDRHIKVDVTEPAYFDDRFPVRAAIATLLFKVMPVDGESHPMERDRLIRILADDFNLSPNESEELVQYASVQGAVIENFQQMADLLKIQVPRKELLTLVSHMWEMVFADGRLHESEILYVERVADLLNIPVEDVKQAMNH